MPAVIKRLGDLLLEKQLITKQELAKALGIQKKTGRRLGDVLVDEGFIDEETMINVLSERLGIPTISLTNLFIDPQIIDLVPVEIAKKFGLVPVFAIAKTLTVAMSDPLNVIALDELAYHTKLKINRVTAMRDEIRTAVENYYSVKDSVREAIAQAQKKEQRIVKQTEGERVETVEEPIVRLVDLLLQQAVKDRASDIHIEPDLDTVRVRYRINGVLKEVDAPPVSLQQAITTRLKVMSGMDLSEKRIPQDGRTTLRTKKFHVDLRVSTLPTIHGEKVVIRILDRSNLNKTLEDYGITGKVLKQWNKAIRKPEGLLLVTGPTGSGKTSTLYATLQTINSIEKNIITVEDPVEYNLPLINQVQINEKANLTFASCLRSILRQNPDIIMVGEIRDFETAVMAIRSALTGHLVLSTIHTNDAAGAIARLIDLGVERYLVSASLQAVLAQRLVRTICSACKAEHELTERELNELRIPAEVEHPTFYEGRACHNCGNIGYDGRTGVFEVLVVDDHLRNLISAGASNTKIQTEGLRAGGGSLYDNALEKALSGVTTAAEVIRVAYSSEQTATELV